MGYIVRMPSLGMQMKQGEIVTLYVEEGDDVSEEQVLADIESEKASAEVTAVEAGTIRRLFASAGDILEPREPMAILADEDDDVEALLAEAEENWNVDADPSAEEAGASDDSRTESTPPPSSGGADSATNAGDSSTVRAAPKARKLAQELDIDLARVQGSGPGGAITVEDIERTAASAPSALTPATETELGGMRRTIADRLGRSYREAVHVTVTREIDVEALVGAAAAADDSLDIDVSITDVLIRAVSAVLEDHPEFNARFENDLHRIYGEHNISLAVDVADGLVSPTLRDVGSKSLREIAIERREMTERVGRGEHTVDDLKGGTFTISNLGPLGADAFTPIIDPPQVAILGVGRVRRKAVPTETGDADFRRHAVFSLTFDHRVVDGADAARWLDSLAGIVGDERALREYEGVDAIEGPATRSAETRDLRVENPAGYAGTYSAAGVETTIPFDEPTDVGGSGLDPTPVEHLLGALGSCLSLAFRQMAGRDEIDVGAITCDVDGTPDHGALESVEVTMTIESSADSEEIDRAVRKAQRACYVERSLGESVEITVEWQRTG